MELNLKRIFLGEEYTIGHLYINNVYFCDVIEDKVRDKNKSGKFDNGEVKIKHKTAIPYGRYKVIMSFSEHFQRILPLLLDVPEFSGILIHNGNTELDTSGCLIVGENKVKGKVINSNITLEKLLNRIYDEKGTIYITIE